MNALRVDHDYASDLQTLKQLKGPRLGKALQYIPSEQEAYVMRKLQQYRRRTGWNQVRCVFAASLRGGPARGHPVHGTCIFCTPGILQEKCTKDAGIARLRETKK